MTIYYRLLGGRTVQVELLRAIRPLDSGFWAGEPRAMIRHTEAVDTHNIPAGTVRAVLCRYLIRA